MVKVAIAAASSNVAQEVIDALYNAQQKYELLLLFRELPSPAENRWPTATCTRTDYKDTTRLTEILNGVHTVLSFIAVQSDVGNASQRVLIDCCICAGVKRFAPSEWATSKFDHLPWYQGKAEIRKYLEEVNRKKKVLEYCCFLPGLFTNYLVHPFPSAKYFRSFEMHIDFHNLRALVMEGSENDLITLTSAQDFAQVVARAVEYEGEWPLIGGIKGTEISIGELVALGERVRGQDFAIERLKEGDLKAGKVNCTWLPKVDFPGVSPEAFEQVMAGLVSGMLLATSDGALNVSDEWNRLLPDFHFTSAEEFLSKQWSEHRKGENSL